MSLSFYISVLLSMTFTGYVFANTATEAMGVIDQPNTGVGGIVGAILGPLGVLVLLLYLSYQLWRRDDRQRKQIDQVYEDRIDDLKEQLKNQDE